MIAFLSNKIRGKKLTPLSLDIVINLAGYPVTIINDGDGRYIEKIIIIATAAALSLILSQFY